MELDLSSFSLIKNRCGMLGSLVLVYLLSSGISFRANVSVFCAGCMLGLTVAKVSAGLGESQSDSPFLIYIS